MVADDPRFALSGVEAGFAGYGGGAGQEVDVAEAEIAELGAADAGVEEEEDDGAIAELTAARALGGGVGGGAPGVGVGAGVEEGLDLLTGEGDDGFAVGFGDVDGAGVVLIGVSLFYCPRPDAAEAGVDVYNGFGGESAGRTIGDAFGFYPCGH